MKAGELEDINESGGYESDDESDIAPPAYIGDKFPDAAIGMQIKL